MSKLFRRGVAAIAVLGSSLATVAATTTQPASAATGPLCSGVVTVASGTTHAFAVRADGAVYGWGNNTKGQLANGTANNDRPTPVAVDALRGAKQITAGSQFTAVLWPTGVVQAAGVNNYGQLGNGTQAESRTLVNTGLTGVTAIDSGGYHTLALKSDGTVWSWGRNMEGQTGGTTPGTRLTPAQVPGLTNVVSVAAGWYHSLAVKADGTVWAWGHNADGQLGIGNRVTQHAPVQIAGLTGVASVAGGANFSGARMNDGTVRTWGHNGKGQLGSPGFASRLSPGTVPDLAGVTNFDLGTFHAMATTSDGKTWTWGANNYGQLGTGDPSPVGSRPEQSFNPIAIAASDASVVTSGATTSYAVRGGTVWAWGLNSSGQIGNGTTTNANGPVQSGCPNGAKLPWALALSADPPVASPGMPVVLNAIANQDVADTPYAIQIFDKESGVLLGSCSTGSSCTAAASSATPTSRSYVAYIATPSLSNPPPFSQTSAETTVRWGTLGPGPYSDSCYPSTLPVLDVDVDQFDRHAHASVKQVSAEETWICFRFNDSSNWVGGRIALFSPALFPPTVAVDEAPPSTCARSGNQAPGPHPLVSDPLGTVDVYANGTEAWICISSLGATRRVKVGSSLPSGVSVNLDGL